MAAPATAAAHRAAIQDSGPAHLWPLSVNSGDQMLVAHMTAENSPTYGATDPWGGPEATQLTPNAHFRRDNAPAIGTDFSIEVWVKATTSAEAYIFSAGSGCTLTFFRGDRMAVLQGTGDHFTAIANDNQWHHWAWTVAGATRSRLYRDGQLQQEVAISTAFPGIASGTWVFGALWFLNSATIVPPMTGSLSHMAWFNRELTAGEVSNHYNGVVAIPTVTGMSPQAGIVGQTNTVVVSGTLLGTATGVLIGSSNTPGTSFSASANAVQFNVPTSMGAGGHAVTVQLPSGNLAAGTFTLSAAPSGAPTISSIAPTSGVAGSQVTIVGTNLLGATGVTFGGTAGGSPVVIDNNTMTVNVPSVAVGSRQVIVVHPTANATSPVSFTVTAPPPAGAPYQWQLLDGSLPAGLAFTSTSAGAAQITGTPSEDGNFPITLRVSDSVSSVQNSYTIVVQPTVKIETIELPDAMQGSFYMANLAAHGGLQPYQWSLVAGILPLGLSLDPATGVISGIPL